MERSCRSPLPNGEVDRLPSTLLVERYPLQCALKAGKIEKSRKKVFLQLTWGLLQSPEYRLRDALNLFGYKAYTHIIEREMPDFDAEALGCEYQRPVYYINGDSDFQTPYELAKAYYGKTVAPETAFFTLKNCAHCWDLDAPEQMADVMCREIAPRLKE